MKIQCFENTFYLLILYIFLYTIIFFKYILNSTTVINFVILCFILYTFHLKNAFKLKSNNMQFYSKAFGLA